MSSSIHKSSSAGLPSDAVVIDMSTADAVIINMPTTDEQSKQQALAIQKEQASQGGRNPMLTALSTVVDKPLSQDVSPHAGRQFRVLKKRSGLTKRSSSTASKNVGKSVDQTIDEFLPKEFRSLRHQPSDKSDTVDDWIALLNQLPPSR
jgi:hypothetical protein